GRGRRHLPHASRHVARCDGRDDDRAQGTTRQGAWHLPLQCRSFDGGAVGIEADGEGARRERDRRRHRHLQGQIGFRPMRKIVLWGIAAAAILSGVAGGYRLGSGQWPTWHAIALLAAGEKSTAPEAASAERAILYWKHPDGTSDFSATPRKTPDGRDY